MVAEKVVVQLVLDTSRYTSGAQKAAKSTGQIGQSVDKTSKSMGSFQSTALKAGAALGAAFAAKTVLDFAKSSIAAFSSLTESVNAVNVVYGEAAAGVHRLGEDSVEQFGLSTRAVNDAAVGMGAFAAKIDEADPADAFKNIIQRATDFGSVMDITTEESLDKFRAALSGEAEPLKRFGINVSEANVKLFALETGLIVAGEAMDETQKIQARYGFVMQETAKTAGDFANTSDGLAGRQKKLGAQWEEMQATVGKELAPAMAELLRLGTELIPLFAKLAGKIKGVVEVAVPLIELVANVTELLGANTDAVEENADATEDAGLRWGKVFEGLPGFISLQKDLLVAYLDNANAVLSNADAFEGYSGTLDLMAVREARVTAETIKAEQAQLAATQAYDAGDRVLGNYNAAVKAAATDSVILARLKRDEGKAVREAATAQQEAADPLLHLLRSSDRLVDAEERLLELKEDEEATAQDIASATIDALEAQGEFEGAAANATGQLDLGLAALIRWGDELGINRDIIIDIARELGLLPTSLDFDLNINTRLFGGSDTPGGVRRAIERAGGRQHGGPVTAGAPFIVGEAGPELFIPNQDGRIVANNKLGGGGVTVNVNQPVTLDLASDISAGLIAGQVTQLVEGLRV